MKPNDIAEYVRDLYRTKDFIPLHAPQFKGNEKRYVSETIDSTFVSSVGAYVDQFEKSVGAYTGTYGIATTNGTSALHAALHLVGVKPGTVVITQSLTFVATCNAISHLGAEPAFVDVSEKTMGLCPKALGQFLADNAELGDEGARLKGSGKPISAVVPMHTFGHPVELNALVELCQRWRIPLVEDAAESLGSFYRGKHTGTFGQISAVSFNGNKIITTGGGGMLLTCSEAMAKKAKHITTTAKVPHPYEFVHDEVGFNYRLPNLNAALGCAQMEVLGDFVARKRELAAQYRDFFATSSLKFFEEPEGATSNYWLNALVCESDEQRNELLTGLNEQGVMCRPIWTLMHKLPMFSNAISGSMSNSEFFESRVVNIPSSPILD